MTAIFSQIYQFTIYVLFFYPFEWDGYTFTLWNVVEFHILVFCILCCLIVLIRTFSHGAIFG